MIQGLIRGYVNAFNQELSVLAVGGRWLVGSNPYNEAKPTVEVGGYAVFVNRRLVHVVQEKRHPIAALETVIRYVRDIASSWPMAHAVRQVSFHMSSLVIDEVESEAKKVSAPAAPGVSDHVVNLCRERYGDRVIDSEELWLLAEEVDETTWKAQLVSDPEVTQLLTVDEINIFFRRPNLYDFG